MRPIIIILVSLLLACGEKPVVSPEKKPVDRPQLPAQCNHGECEQDQWRNEYDTFALVAGDALQMRSAPTTKSASVGSLPLSGAVTVLLVASEVETIDNSAGHWCFVRDLSTEQGGWIFGLFLATPSKFGTPFQVRKLEFGIGDAGTTITCSVDNRCSRRHHSKEIPDDITQGSLLVYRRIVWFRPDSKPLTESFPQLFALNGDDIGLRDYYASAGSKISVTR